MPASDDLLAHYPIISDQVSKDDIGVVLRELEATLQRNVPGNIVEFGCYIGTTSLFIRRLLDALGQSAAREFHVYDSFAGLPTKTIEDASIAGSGFRAGELNVSKRQLVREFKHVGLQLPVIHKGWFRDLTDRDVPEQIAFGFLDGDFYDSILSSLQLVWPRVAPGGTVLIDDYGREALPGVERAVRAYFRGDPPAVRISHDIAIVRRPQ